MSPFEQDSLLWETHMVTEIMGGQCNGVLVDGSDCEGVLGSGFSLQTQWSGILGSSVRGKLQCQDFKTVKWGRAVDGQSRSCTNAALLRIISKERADIIAEQNSTLPRQSCGPSSG